MTKLSKKILQGFSSTKFYSVLLSTDIKKRIMITLFIFLLAFSYRYSMVLVDRGSLFYASLGGGGDYDQFIRAATCAIREFCSLTLNQNLLVESFILSLFYEMFGFIGSLKTYLYLMLILSSIVAVLPYVLLSKKNWFTIGGITGSLFLVTSDFLSQVALSFPPDNGSTFLFSMFFVVYLLTMNFGTIRWLLFFGLTGFADGMFKALFLINDVVALSLFAPVFFFEKARKSGKKILQKKNIKILLFSLVPLMIFLAGYTAWEKFVSIKFSAVYFLRGLIETKGSVFTTYTVFRENPNIISGISVLTLSVIVMIKRLIQYADLREIFLAPIFFGLLLVSFIKLPQGKRIFSKKLILSVILSIILIVLLVSFKNNYFNTHEVFSGDYIAATWTDETYIKIFLASEIIILFIVNFGYQALKLSLPILPYVIILLVLTKNSPFPRISTQVIVWMVILLAFITDWILVKSSNRVRSKRGIAALLILIIFFLFHTSSKIIVMAGNFNSGIAQVTADDEYLKWVEKNIPSNAVILAGGKSDLIQIAENIKKPIVYNTMWTGALLIRPNEIPEISPDDFNITSELQNKKKFKEKRYLILENDVFVWKARIAGVGDGVFTADPLSISALHGSNYLIKVYKYNPTLKKGIYELNFLEDQSTN